MPLDSGNLPSHVAIIMDGNRRWARQKHLPIVMGHRKVVEERIEELVDHAGHLGIPYITFWAFSTENWERCSEEVNSYMQLFRWAFAHKAKKLADNGAKLKIIGDISCFEKDIRESVEYWVEQTKDNNKITVAFALNYGGRDELTRACNKLLLEISNEKLQITKISEQLLGQNLDTAGMPDPDLIIRPGGEQRLSGFMLWQCAYSELYFTKTLMPDFGSEELDKALEEYSSRERRRGK